jgi:predicted DNA binding CopG/RHH family protein
LFGIHKKKFKMRRITMNETDMLDEYDFSGSVRNPYPKLLKRPVTIRLETETIGYFKKLALDTGIPYQTLINLFLSQCAREQKKPDVVWK